MQAFALLAVAIVAAFIVAIAIGLAWFLVVPVAILLLLLPVAFAIHLFSQRRSGASASEGRSGLASDVSGAVPTTHEASYQPISDPSRPGATPR
jgi:hypothetical protein